MAIKLSVKRTDQEQSPVEYNFEEQDVITIGRDSSADLTLYDDETMVSRLHARLELEGGSYHLSDLGSRNFTMLRGEQLTPGRQYPLSDGDTFNVANYEVQFFRTAAAKRDFGETRFDAGFVNPFISHAETLVHVLTAMETEYEKLPEVRVNAALAEALKSIVPKLKKSPVFSVITAEAGVSPSAQAPPPPEPAKPPLPQPPTPVQAPPFPSPVAAPPMAGTPFEPPPAAATPPGPSPVAGPREQSVTPLNLKAANRSRLDRVLDLVIDYMSRQVKVPWQFRYEFIGHTFIPTEDTKGIYETDAGGLADFLFNPEHSGDEFERRLALVQEALDEALAHQMALLEGYRDAVSAGTRLMIEQMDPQKVLDSVREENPAFKYVSFLAQFKAWSVLAARHFDFTQEDVSVLERRTYRPAFIKSYLERMASVKKSG